MIKSLKRYSVAGFSLVELMVVVAIIGILAAVAIPNFNKFQRRARAAEGKTALGGLYNSQKSFLAEWEDYSASLAAIGYTFDGTPRTNLTTGALAGGAVGAARYIAEATMASATTQVAGYSELGSNAAGGLCGNAIFMPGCMVGIAATVPGAATAGAFALGAGPGIPGTWTARANTNVGSSADEVWSMTETKTLAQVVDGVNAN